MARASGSISKGRGAKERPSQGYQLPLTPAQLYRIALDEIAREVADKYQGKTFRDLPPDQQDAVLRDLESGAANLPSVPSAILFETLLANTIEGFFSDPAYGGNRDMAGWRMVGFPGVSPIREAPAPF
jgi:gluconate 2-dehydrogenase gamma chain